MAGRTNGDIILHAFIAGLLSFGATALIYTYLYDDESIKKNERIRQLEKKVEELESAHADEEMRADEAAELANSMATRVQNLEKEVNDLLGLVAKIDTTMKDYKNKAHLE